MRKDYLVKSYKNPLYQKKKKQRPINKKIIALVLLLIIFGSFFYFFKTQGFIITSIEVVGNITIPTLDIQERMIEQMSQKRFFLFDQKYLFFFNTPKALQLIEKQFSFKKLSIKKKYPHTIKVEIEERKPYAVFEQKTGALYIDEEGVIISYISDKGLQEENFSHYDILRHKLIYKNLPIIQTKENFNTDIHTKPLDQKNFYSIKKIIHEMFSQSSFTINFFEYNKMERTLHAVSADNIKMYFDLDGMIDQQIQKLRIILANKEEVGNIHEYIDLRYGDKVFFK